MREYHLMLFLFQPWLSSENEEHMWWRVKGYCTSETAASNSDAFIIVIFYFCSTKSLRLFFGINYEVIIMKYYVE